MPRVSVVVPNWNGSALLGQVLPDLRDQELCPEEVIVVDNGSTDNSVAIAKAAGAKVLGLTSNLGFSRAVNRGIEACRSEWIAVLNNDVRLKRPWLARLVEKAEAQGAWFATGKLLNASDNSKLDGTYDAICRGACAWRCGHGRQDAPLWNQGGAIRFAPFTASIFRAELFQKVGVLDEDFESYLEDIDFGLRCSIQRLFGIYVPEAVAYHQGSATLGRWHPDTVRKIARNQVLLVAKHYPARWIFRSGWAVLAAQSLWGLIALRHGAGFAFVKGKLEGLQQFRRARRCGPPAVWEILEESEGQIRDLQKLAGFDFYWKAYFALT
jgi:GT2 family glycosyltransferase